MTQKIAAVESKSGTTLPVLPTRFVFEKLDDAGIRYALLRGFEELATANGDTEIDLLAHPADVRKMMAVFGRAGFVELPGWGHAPHRFLVAPSAQTGAWVKLDIVTALYYGRPYRHLRADFAERCLRDRRRRDGVWVLSEACEFSALILHCLLDKGRFDDKHKTRLRELVESLFAAGNAANPATATDGLFTGVFEMAELGGLIAGGRWQELAGHERKLKQQLLRQSRLRAFGRWFSARLLRGLRPVLFFLKRRGVSAVLLAPDGAGKSTLAASLARDKFLRARLVYMGTNVEASTVGFKFTPKVVAKARQVNKSRNRKRVPGRIFRGLNLVVKLAEHWYRCFYARYQLARGRFIIFDRFIYDAWIQKRKLSLFKRLRRLLFDAACPRPDLVVLLDAPGDLLFARKGEHSPEWIDQQRAGYHQLLDLLPQMVVVDAARSADEVRLEVTRLIWANYGTRAKSKE